jgi:molybdopterin-binding protein
MAEISKEAFDEMNLTIGQEVYIIIKLRRLRFTE